MSSRARNTEKDSHGGSGSVERDIGEQSGAVRPHRGHQQDEAEMERPAMLVGSSKNDVLHGTLRTKVCTTEFT